MPKSGHLFRKDFRRPLAFNSLQTCLSAEGVSSYKVNMRRIGVAVFSLFGQYLSKSVKTLVQHKLRNRDFIYYTKQGIQSLQKQILTAFNNQKNPPQHETGENLMFRVATLQYSNTQFSTTNQKAHKKQGRTPCKEQKYLTETSHEEAQTSDLPVNSIF